jgi:hypothetical protein
MPLTSCQPHTHAQVRACSAPSLCLVLRPAGLVNGGRLCALPARGRMPACSTASRAEPRQACMVQPGTRAHRASSTRTPQSCRCAAPCRAARPTASCSPRTGTACTRGTRRWCRARAGLRGARARGQLRAWRASRGRRTHIVTNQAAHLNHALGVSKRLKRRHVCMEKYTCYQAWHIKCPPRAAQAPSAAPKQALPQDTEAAGARRPPRPT